MSVFNTQSDIGEVRDQLSLDYADGKYLNVVSSNLGMQRPPFGFSDDTWRALVKVLSLQYKQIRTKFEAILSIVLGPKTTQVGALAQACNAGDRHAVLVSSAQFPQVGTMVIDEGMATEETIEYCYIDRYSNTVYFTTPLVQNHTPVNQEWESGIISEVPAGGLRYNVFDASGFPDPVSVEYPLIIGRGTPYETVAPATSYDLLARWIEGPVLAAGGPGADTASGQTVTGGALASQQNVYYLTMADVSKLPVEKGYIQAELATNLTATGGTVTSVTVAGPLTADVYGGHWIRFTGNVTAALANQVAYVQDNTATTLSFANTLGSAPAVGDTFTVLANFQYIRTDVDDDSLLMMKEFPDLQTVAANLVMTVIRPQMTAAIAQVQVKGVGWEVFQSDPRHVEILLPEVLLASDLRSASYIRDSSLTGTSTANLFRASGSTDLAVGSTALMPLIGVLDHAASGNRYAYYTSHAWLTADAAAGDTTITVNDTSQFLSTGTLLINGATVIYTVTDATTIATAPLPAAAGRGTLVQDAYRFRLAKPSLADVNIADTLNFYADYQYGDLWDIDDVWPGPYVWDIFSEIHKEETVPGNSVNQNLSGPTYLSVDRLVGDTVFEVEDASSFPTTVPFNILLGENSGNVETLAVQEVSLKSRTFTTLSGNTLAGDTTLPVAALAGPVAPLNTFPDGGPYRVVVAPFTANAEVLEVSSTDPLTLNLSQPATLPHSSGDRVVLLSDLLRVSPAAADDHTGRILSTNRFGLYARETQVNSADMVRPLYTDVTLNLAGTDFNTEADEAVFNFGNKETVRRGRLRYGSTVAGSPILLAGNALPGDTTVRPIALGPFPHTYPYQVQLVDGAFNELVTVIGKTPPFLDLDPSTPVVNSYFAGPGTVQVVGHNVVLEDSTDFPTIGYPYVVTVDVGAGPLLEERLHVTNNNVGTGELTVSHPPVFAAADFSQPGHPGGRLVEFRPGAPEVVSYTSRTGSTLSFTPYLLIENTHYEVEYLAPTVGTGFPRDEGYDFPLRLPVTVEDRIRFMVDLVRAAGVEVTFISKR